MPPPKEPPAVYEVPSDGFADSELLVLLTTKYPLAATGEEALNEPLNPDAVTDVKLRAVGAVGAVQGFKVVNEPSVPYKEPPLYVMYAWK